MIRDEKSHRSLLIQPNDAPRLLVIGGSPPGTGCVGEIILRDFCLNYPAGHIYCFAVCHYKCIKKYSPPMGLEQMPIRLAAWHHEHGCRPFTGILGFFTVFIDGLVFLPREAKRLVNEAVTFGREYRVDKVLMILDTTTTIAMGAEVARQLSVPLLSLVWDAPEYFLVIRKWDRYTRKRLLARFGETLRLSEKVAVVSETMQKDYQKDYGARTIIVRHGLEMDDSQKRIKAGGYISSEFIIGFAGALYAHSAWEAFLQILAENDWRIAGRRVVLKVMGGDFHFRTKKKMNIHFLGWQSPEDTAKILAGCDVNYLPHPFEPELHCLAHYSFPTKLSTYLAAGRPVFVHAPPWSALTPFCTRNQVGILCESLAGPDILSSLERLATDAEFYAESARQAGEFSRTEFSNRNFLRQFFAFVGIEPAAMPGLLTG